MIGQLNEPELKALPDETPVTMPSSGPAMPRPWHWAHPNGIAGTMSPWFAIRRAGRSSP